MRETTPLQLAAIDGSAWVWPVGTFERHDQNRNGPAIECRDQTIATWLGILRSALPHLGLGSLAIMGGQVQTGPVSFPRRRFDDPRR
jgi:hypothetical protein